MQKENLIIKGRVFWTSVHTVNPYSGKYQVDISVDDDTAKMLESLGVRIKHESDMKEGKNVGTANDRGTFVSASRKPETKDGKPMTKVMVIDAKKQVLGPEVSIGNGTLAKIKVSPYDWKFKGKSGVSLDFSVIQVIDLVEFKLKGLDGFEEEEGFTASTKDSSGEAETLDDILSGDEDSSFDID